MFVAPWGPSALFTVKRLTPAGNALLLPIGPGRGEAEVPVDSIRPAEESQQPGPTGPPAGASPDSPDKPAVPSSGRIEEQPAAELANPGSTEGDPNPDGNPARKERASSAGGRSKKAVSVRPPGGEWTVYSSQGEAAKALGINEGAMSSIIRGINIKYCQKKLKGYEFKRGAPTSPAPELPEPQEPSLLEEIRSLDQPAEPNTELDVPPGVEPITSLRDKVQAMLQELGKYRNVTQPEIARECKVDKLDLSLWMRGLPLTYYKNHWTQMTEDGMNQVMADWLQTHTGRLESRNKLHWIAVAQQLSNPDLAKSIGVDLSYVGKYFKGEPVPEARASMIAEWVQQQPEPKEMKECPQCQTSFANAKSMAAIRAHMTAHKRNPNHILPVTEDKPKPVVGAANSGVKKRTELESLLANAKTFQDLPASGTATRSNPKQESRAQCKEAATEQSTADWLNRENIPEALKSHADPSKGLLKLFEALLKLGPSTGAACTAGFTACIDPLIQLLRTSEMVTDPRGVLKAQRGLWTVNGLAALCLAKLAKLYSHENRIMRALESAGLKTILNDTAPMLYNVVTPELVMRGGYGSVRTHEEYLLKPGSTRRRAAMLLHEALCTDKKSISAIGFAVIEGTVAAMQTILEQEGGFARLHKSKAQQAELHAATMLLDRLAHEPQNLDLMTSAGLGGVCAALLTGAFKSATEEAFAGREALKRLMKCTSGNADSKGIFKSDRGPTDEAACMLEVPAYTPM